MLASILQSFGNVTGQVTNIHNGSLAPIRCSNVDLDMILGDFHAVQAQFPLKYLGLPISIHWLWAVDFQHLLDKIARKIMPVRGKFLTMAL